MLVHPNVLRLDNSKTQNANYKFNQMYTYNSDKLIAAGIQPRSKSPIIQEDHRSYKIKMDY